MKTKRYISALDFRMKFRHFSQLYILTVVLFTSSCQKLVEVPPPPKSISTENIFTTDLTAIGALNGIIRGNMTTLNSFMARQGSLLSDDLKLLDLSKDQLLTQYYQNALTESTDVPWGSIYGNIFSVNLALEGLDESTSLTPSIKTQLLGEAKFMRAFDYFYAVNLFGEVPLALTSNYETNRLLHRSPITDVYAIIVNDLLDAQNLLSKSYLSGTLQAVSTERVRPTFWAATALLARVYLYMGEYSKAIDESSKIITNSALFSLPTLNNAFLKNSSETIWSIELVPGAFSTEIGTLFLPVENTVGNDIYCLNSYLLDSFEAGDDRRNNWVGTASLNNAPYYYANKYKAGANNTILSEYEIVLRLAEQYLIRAEAQARLNKLDLAVGDLNVIRSRARAASTTAIPNPLPNLSTGSTQVQVIAAVEHERQTELFTEWGNRWFDLKRLPALNDPNRSRADEVMPTVTQSKGGNWNSNWKLLPIPLDERLRNPSMLNEQNPGY